MFVSCSSSPYCRILSGAIQLGGVGGMFWFAAAPLFTGMVIGPFLGVVDGGPATYRMALLLFIPSVVGKCQQGCQQMSTTWPTNASNPKLKFVKPLASCFPPPLASELCIKGVVPSPRHPFFSSKYEKSGANIWLYGKNYVPLQSQLRNGASAMRSKVFLHIAEWSSW